MKVIFNELEEFIQELEKDKGKIERGIIRTTIRYVATKISPNIKHIIACSTYSVEGQIVEFEGYCGDEWGLHNDTDEGVHNIADIAMKRIEEIATENGLEVRHGALEDKR